LQPFYPPKNSATTSYNHFLPNNWCRDAGTAVRQGAVKELRAIKNNKIYLFCLFLLSNDVGLESNTVSLHCQDNCVQHSHAAKRILATTTATSDEPLKICCPSYCYAIKTKTIKQSACQFRNNLPPQKKRADTSELQAHTAC